MKKSIKLFIPVFLLFALCTPFLFHNSSTPSPFTPSLQATPSIPVPVPPTDVLISIPPTLTIPAGRIAILTCTTDCKIVKWKINSTNVDLISVPGNTKQAYFCSPNPGNFKVFCWTALGNIPSDIAICKVTVSGPVVPDTLRDSIQALYTANISITKKDSLTTLTSLYKQAITTTVNDPSIITPKQLLDIMHNSAQVLLNNELQDIRTAISKELVLKFPTDPNAPINSAGRALIINEFQRLVDVLSSIQ